MFKDKDLRNEYLTKYDAFIRDLIDDDEFEAASSHKRNRMRVAEYLGQFD